MKDDAHAGQRLHLSDVGADLLQSALIKRRVETVPSEWVDETRQENKRKCAEPNSPRSFRSILFSARQRLTVISKPKRPVMIGPRTNALWELVQAI